MSASRRTCDELGVCQNTGLCAQCSDGTGAQRAPSSAVSPEVGNVWFSEPEPPEPMTRTDCIAVAALALVSAFAVVGSLHWLYQTLFITH